MGRAVHLSMHAQFSNWSDASERRYKQIERWGQFKLRNPPNANLPPEHDKLDPERRSQGGVVDPRGHWWLPRVDAWRDRSPLECHSGSKGLQVSALRVY